LRLRIATYNIHRAIGVDRRFRPERIQGILRDHSPDLVLLQEVDEGAPRSRELDLAQEMAEALGYPHYAIGHNVSLRKGRYGNATLSRWPILRERNIDLTIGRRKRRGCQHTTLDLGAAGGAPLEVFNLHLGLSGRERRQQMGLLISAQEFAALGHESAVIVGGDFNDWVSELRPLLVEALAFRCATDRPSKRGPRAIRTYPAFSPRGGLDRLYFRGGLQLRSVYRCRHRAARLASDHLPVFAEFEWPGVRS
jgi:endonuclease/exonuclease/phosphatase family metal-dependent hydrolase